MNITENNPNPTSSSDHQAFIDKIALSFQDLRNINVEQKFSQNKTFQKEFKLDQGERILYLNYKNLWFTRFKILTPTLIILLMVSSIPLFVNLAFFIRSKK